MKGLLLNPYTLKPGNDKLKANTWEWRCDYCGSTTVYAGSHTDLNTGESTPNGRDELFCGGGVCEGEITATICRLGSPFFDPPERA